MILLPNFGVNKLSLPPLVFFTIFSSFIWSKASFIGELEPLGAILL